MPRVRRASLAAFAPVDRLPTRRCGWWARFERMSASPSAVLAPDAPEQRASTCATCCRRSAPRPSCCTASATRGCASRGAGTSPANIPGAKLVELPGDDHLLWAGDVDRSPTRWRSSSPALAPISSPTASSRPSCSPTSSTRRSGPLELGDRRWRELLDQHDACCARRSRAFAAGRSRRSATGSSRPSTDRRARSAAARASSTRRARSTSMCGAACIPARSRSRATISAGSRSTSRRGWRALPNPIRSWSRAPSAISSPGPISSSPIAARTR